MSHIRPVHYAIHITPDLQQFEFKGQSDIQFQIDAISDHIELDILELAIWRCAMKKDGDWIDLPFCVQPANQRLEISLPEPTMGVTTLRIEYQGIINDKMGGFYRSRTSQGNLSDIMAVTQFQESSARQAFPCMDHPLHKAVFQLTVTAPEHLVVLANTLPQQEMKVGNQQKRIVFQPSPPMSTYLLFFGIGPFELALDPKDHRVRLAHLPGMGHTTGLGLTFGRKALHYCEAYYDIPYPLPKMDLIAVPDFAFGAMENWGAITFRENLLLHFPDLTSKAGIQRICEVIAHEIAHQWFGNLVTPADWKYLWLNESFATYFGYGVVAHYHPSWGVWDQFLLTESASALSRDGLKSTVAIEMPGDAAVAINAATAPIIYNKGASILRMIQGVIGPAAYQQGVRGYLRRHQYRCAESQDLWQAFEAASDQPITAMMQNWIGQPGHPLVTVVRRGRRLTLQQKRFTYLDAPSDQLWIIPITVAAWTTDGRRRTMTLRMETATAALDLPEDTQTYKINCDQHGFYRVHYADEVDRLALGDPILHQTMGVEDRWGIQNDLFALVRQTSLPLADYLDYLTYYAAETDYLPLASIAGHLAHAQLAAPPNRRGAIVEQGHALVERVLQRIDFMPAAEEPQTVTLLRDQMLWLGALWGYEPVVIFGKRQFERLVAGGTVHPDISRGILQIAAWHWGDAALEWLRNRFGKTPSEHERMNILAALGAFSDWRLGETALAFAVNDVPPRNRFLPIVAAAANPAAQPHLWSWFQSNLKSLEMLHPLLFERVITAIVPFGGLDREEEATRFGRAYVTAHPHLSDAMDLALENLAVNRRMRQHLEK